MEPAANVFSIHSVDLGFLQLVRVVDVHGLPLGVEIYRANAAFAVAVAGGFGAAEGQVHFGSDCRRVDVGDAGVEVANGGEGLVHIFGVERGRKSVLDAVGDLYGVFEVVAGDDGNDGAEDFFLRDAHLGIDVSEDGRLHEPAVLVLALVEAIAAAHQLCAFVFADLDVAKIGLKLLLIDRRTHLDRFVEAVADFQFLRARDVALDELAIDALLHDDAAGRGATLAGGAESAPEAAFDGEVEVGVVEDDHGILAAEFERAVFESLGRDAAYDAADGGRSGERDGAHVGVLGERSAYVRAEAGHDVDDAFGKAGVGEGANQVERGEWGVLRGLDDAGVAADDGGQQLPGRDRHGKVPGRDHAADADGLAHGHGELVGHLGGDGGAEEAAAFAGVVVSGVDGFLHVTARLGEHLAHFAGHVAGVIFFALDENFGGAENHFGAARGGDEAPFGEGALGRVHGGVDVGLGGLLEDADHVARVGGIAVFESLS